MIVPRYYEDLHMLHENTMPDRSYYVPAGVKMDGSLAHTFNPRAFCLNIINRIK